MKSLSASSEQVNFALSWLSFLDKEEFDEAWKRSDKVLQLEFSNSAEWGEFINRARGFCCAEKTRKILQAGFCDSVEGVAKKGVFAVISFSTTMDDMSIVREEIIIEQNDGVWKVVGYSI